MSRYPNPLGASEIFSGRANGFFNRRLFTVAGVHSFALPPNTPVDHRGLVRLRGLVIGAGAGGVERFYSNESVYDSRSGAGGGFSQKEIWVPPTATGSVVIGAPGQNVYQRDIGAPPLTATPGGLSSITVAGETWSGGGGSYINGGVGTGGDLNTTGGPSTGNSGATNTPGATSGSPWGHGRANGKWRMPRFWDLEDFNNTDLFAELTGIGEGGADTTPASFGGGAQSHGVHTGGGGLAIIYW